MAHTIQHSSEKDQITRALWRAGEVLGVREYAMAWFVRRGLAVFNVLDADGRPMIVTPYGEVVYSTDGITPLQPEEWGLALIQEEGACDGP